MTVLDPVLYCILVSRPQWLDQMDIFQFARKIARSYLSRILLVLGAGGEGGSAPVSSLPDK